MDDLVLTTVNIYSDLFDRIKQIASDEGSTPTDIINRALALESFYVDVVKSGGKIIEEDREGKMFVITRKKG